MGIFDQIPKNFKMKNQACGFSVGIRITQQYLVERKKCGSVSGKTRIRRLDKF